MAKDEIAWKVYLWQNDMVMAFGVDGEQIPELQGKLTRELVDTLQTRSTPDTLWHVGHWIDGAAKEIVAIDDEPTVNTWMAEAEQRLSPEYLGWKKRVEEAVANAYIAVKLITEGKQMSGGSFGYAYSVTDLFDVLDKQRHWNDLQEAFEDEGFDDIAAEIAAMLVQIALAERRVMARVRRLQDAAEAMEWWRSGDSSRDRVEQAVAKLRGEE